MQPLAQALSNAADAILVCGTYGNLDTVEPCLICMDEKRDQGIVCVVEDVADLWALERTRSFKGRYHVLGGRLSALDGVGPEDLNIASLIGRAEAGDIREVILAMNLTVDGQTTAPIADRLAHAGVEVTRLAHGVLVGGELDFDDGTSKQRFARAGRSDKGDMAFASSGVAVAAGLGGAKRAADISMAIYEAVSVVEKARRITVAKGDSTLALDGLPDGVQPDTLVANFAAGSGV